MEGITRDQNFHQSLHWLPLAFIVTDRTDADIIQSQRRPELKQKWQNRHLFVIRYFRFCTIAANVWPIIQPYVGSNASIISRIFAKQFSLLKQRLITKNITSYLIKPTIFHFPSIFKQSNLIKTRFHISILSSPYLQSDIIAFRDHIIAILKPLWRLVTRNRRNSIKWPVIIFWN